MPSTGWVSKGRRWVVAADPPFSFVGRAYTVRMLPRGLSGKSVGDYIDEVSPGEVVVIDNGGRLDATVWGDILTSVAHRNGVAGTVIDGVCRDTGRSLELGYPLYSRSHTMRTGKDRVSAEEYGCPCNWPASGSSAGDWLRGDGDGVVVVPASRIDAVLAAAEEIAAAEDVIRAEVAQGGRLDEIRTRANYHGLQSRPSPAESEEGAAG